VHTGRAGAYYNAGKAVGLDGILDHILTRFGTHILVIGGIYNAVLVGKCLCNSLYVYGCRDITAAPTNKYADFLHLFQFLSRLLGIFTESGDDCLLRQIFVQQCGDIVGFQVVCALTANRQKANGLYQLAGLYAAGATLYASHAGETLVDRIGSHQLVDLTLFYHVNKLVRMIFHLVVGGAGAGALTATHTLERVYSAHTEYLFFHLKLGHTQSSFTPSASASSSVK
jgi:hypothetical protein